MLPLILIVCAGSFGLWLGWPNIGLLARWRRARLLAARSQREDVLKYVLKCETNRQPPTIHGVAGVLGITPNRAADLLTSMEACGFISHQDGCLHLRLAGRQLAMHVIRAHRLWESYLADQTGVGDTQWHHQAERQEHLLSPQQTEALAARLGYPVRDPHGDAIPAAGEALESDVGQSLNAAPLNAPLLVAHLEDEPESIFAQLFALGLRPGMKACLTGKSPGEIRLWAEGREYKLSPILANNVSVVPLPELKPEDLFSEEFLDQLQPGEHARVVSLSPACRGAERRRLLDLGFVPGTIVKIEMTSPLRDPVAYRVRGTVIALRSDQARLIRIAREENCGVAV
jgi:DtxR family Mn-dependent transcriptional regulator